MASQSSTYEYITLNVGLSAVSFPGVYEYITEYTPQTNGIWGVSA